MIGLFLVVAAQPFLFFVAPRKFRLNIALVFLGGLLNSTAVIANHGKMPVSGWTGSMKAFEDGNHQVMTADSRVKPLCDIYGPGHFRYSLGDTILVAGALACFGALFRK